MRPIARRVQTLEQEAAGHAKMIRVIVTSWHPCLLDLTAWSHVGRCHDDAAFATLAGTAPIPASSGRTVRHRLKPPQDHQLSRAIYTIAPTSAAA